MRWRDLCGRIEFDELDLTFTDAATGPAMELSIEATYEGGVLKPLVALPLREHEKVRITITDDAQWRTSRVRASAGLIGWKGDAETLERIANDPEFGILESP